MLRRRNFGGIEKVLKLERYREVLSVRLGGYNKGIILSVASLILKPEVLGLISSVATFSLRFGHEFFSKTMLTLLQIQGRHLSVVAKEWALSTDKMPPGIAQEKCC